MNNKTIIALLDQAISLAYAPYSKFKVGAVIIDENGQSHAGCNVENAVYPSGCCAEQSAISNMIIKGGTKITTIYIKSNGNKPCPPCGNCRQKISEFSSQETTVIMLDSNNQTIESTIQELLPHQFNETWLKH